MLGKPQVMPDAQALYEQQIIMAHESSQGAKQQLTQPIKSQHYPSGVAEAGSPRIQARTPTPSEREKEGMDYLRPKAIYYLTIPEPHVLTSECLLHL